MNIKTITFSPTGGTKAVADILARTLDPDPFDIDLTDRFADHEQVALAADDLVLGHNVLQHRLIGNVQVLTALLEGHAKDRAGLQRLRLVVGVDLDDGVAALLLGFQHLQRVGVVAGRNDAVGDLVLDQLRGAQVADIGQRDPVAEAGHTVRTAGTGVGAG